MDAPNHGIRPGRAEDAAPLSALAARIFRETFAPDNRAEDIAAHIAAHFTPARQAAELADPQMVTLVLDAGGTLAGYAQLREGPAPPSVDGPRPLELLRFYVDRPWQGRGVAAALMHAAVAAARARGARTLWLGVWERNPRAIAFYARSGFVDAGSHAFALGADIQTDRIMVRRLDAAP